MAKKKIEQGKALIKSKVFWFNILTLLVAVASLFGFEDFEADETVSQIVILIGGLGNILLRTKTSEPITRIK
jgi:hypothetical protein